MSLVVRSVLQRQGRLATPVEQLDDGANLHQAGLDSMAMVNVMLALEQLLDIEFPEDAMNRRHFASIANLDKLLRQICPDFDRVAAKV